MFVGLVGAVLKMNGVLRWRELGAVLAMKAALMMERVAQAAEMLVLVVFVELLLAASLRRLHGVADRREFAGLRLRRTCRSRPAFLSDEGDDRTSPLHKGNTRR